MQVDVYPKTVQNLQTNYQTKLTSVENTIEKIQEQIQSLYLKIQIDDRKEGGAAVCTKNPNDPFEVLSYDAAPPLSKLQRSILVENQKHTIQQITSLSALLEKLKNCEKQLRQ